MSRYRYLVLALLAASIIMNVVLLMFLVGGRQAATVEQVPAGKNSAVETYKITEDTVMSGGSLPQYQSVEELPASLRQRIEVLHAAKERRFTPLDGIIERFSIREETVPQAVAKLCNDHTVICGLEVVPWPSTSQDPVLRNLKRFSVSFEKASPRQILDSLVSKDPAFLWVEERGIANVVPTKAYNSPAYPLNKKIPQFEVEDRPYTMVFAGAVYPARALFGLPEVQETLPIGGSGRWPPEFAPRVSLRAVDKSIREIINEVSRKVGMSWSLTSCLQGDGESMAVFQMYPQLSLPACFVGKSDVNLPPPEISFENEVYNFGKLDVNETAQCKFKFGNIGDGILRIETINETCGCTVASLSIREYEPGEQGLIEVRYRPQRQPGFVSQDLSIYTNDPANPIVRLLIQGEVVDVTQPGDL